MKIIILGAGQVGTSLATSLLEDHDITMIDTDPDKLIQLQNKYDIRTLSGSGADPILLEEAGANDADMLIAVTNSDECNIVACQIAYSLFKTPTKIARVRSQHFTQYPELFNEGNIPIDYIINPAELVTERLARLVSHPDTLHLFDFAEQKVQLAATIVNDQAQMANAELRELRQNLETIDVRVVAVYRHHECIIPEADFVIKPGDEVLLITKSEHIKTVLSQFAPRVEKYKRLFIAGAGHVGLGIANRLEKKYNIKLLDYSEEQCNQAAEQLKETIVLTGDAADKDLLLSENIDDTDLFCAVTNDDEVNIMSAMLAKRLGAKKTLAIVSRLSYAQLIEGSREIDRAISPQQITTSSILTFLRKGDMIKVYTIHRGQAEVIEVVTHGDKDSSMVIGKSIENIQLPRKTQIGAIVRGNEVIMGHRDVVIEEEDHLILFVGDKKSIKDVEKLFQVSPTFL